MWSKRDVTYLARAQVLDNELMERKQFPPSKATSVRLCKKLAV